MNFIFCPIAFELPSSLEQRYLDFYKTEGGICSFSPALQSPSCFQIFPGRCLAVWLKWKTQIVFFLLREMDSQRAEGKTEPQLESLVSSLGVLGVTPWSGLVEMLWVTHQRGCCLMQGPQLAIYMVELEQNAMGISCSEPLFSMFRWGKSWGMLANNSGVW